MKKTFITIGITLSIFAAIGSFIFLGVTIYGFNKDYIPNIGAEVEKNRKMAEATPSKEKEITQAMKLTPATQKKENVIMIDDDKKAVIIEYMQQLKALKQKQSRYMAYFNHEQDQLKLYKIPNIQVPHLDDLARTDEVITKQKEVMDGIVNKEGLFGELSNIHDSLISCQENLLSYHMKIANYKATEDGQMLKESLHYFSIANTMFRQYKKDFKELCDANGIAFEGNWKEMFPEAEAMGVQIPTPNNQDDSQQLQDQQMETMQNTKDEPSKATLFSDLDPSMKVENIVLGKWVGMCPEEKGDDVNITIEFFDDFSYKKVTGELVYTGLYKVVENNQIEFTNETRGDRVLQVTDDNKYTVLGSLYKDGRITFNGDIRRLGCAHGNYIFTKEK